MFRITTFFLHRIRTLECNLPHLLHHPIFTRGGLKKVAAFLGRDPPRFPGNGRGRKLPKVLTPRIRNKVWTRAPPPIQLAVLSSSPPHPGSLVAPPPIYIFPQVSTPSSRGIFVCPMSTGGGLFYGVHGRQVCTLAEILACVLSFSESGRLLHFRPMPLKRYSGGCLRTGICLVFMGHTPFCSPNS